MNGTGTTHIDLRALVQRLHADRGATYVTDGHQLWQVVGVKNRALFVLEDAGDTRHGVQQIDESAVRLALDYRLVESAPLPVIVE